MANKGGPNFIDGFASVQAVKHSKNAGKGVRTRQSSSKLPALEKPAPEKPAAQGPSPKKISRTVTPEKFKITCYECEYVFTLQGRVVDNFCPKCHEKLLAKDTVIDKEWSENVKTIGRVEIKKGASFPKKCTIIARDAALSADASEADLNIYNKLELSRGAGFNAEDTEIRTLVIAKGTSLTLKGKVKCERLEVLGELRGTIIASAEAHIEKSGSMKGSLEAPSLVVREGAALSVNLRIGEGRK